MNVLELKGSIHDAVAHVEDKSMLELIHRMIKGLLSGDKVDNRFWEDLNEEQRAEIELAFEESEQEDNLITHEEATKMFEKWLKK